MRRFLKKLRDQLEGELHWDTLHQSMYATDASVYHQKPLAVAFPKSEKDVKGLINFATIHRIGLIPRTAGTSLAGQCVGPGIVVDMSKYLTRILALNKENKTVRLEPGVIRDELNRAIHSEGLFFGPNTSTSNRCMIGGMVGNNSSGSTSIQYGVTRDKVVAIRGVLSDGSIVEFKNISEEELADKKSKKTLEGNIYQHLISKLSNNQVQSEIRKEFPDPSIHRRNTGYAVDALLDLQPFTKSGNLFSLCPLLTGSEGTLMMMTEITLKLDLLPPPHKRLLVPHFDSVSTCLEAVVPVMQHQLQSCEMLDKTILDRTLSNTAQLKNRFFIQQDPTALLMLELAAHSEIELQKASERLQEVLKHCRGCYSTAVLEGKDIDRAMSLRKAGLGLLGNMIGDKKAVACIEDTAVPLEHLTSYINEFTSIMKRYDQKAVYYAHAGAGELHLRPILNLKTKKDIRLFRTITTEVAHLVKRYKGSMSGEHGDGIVRSEFIPLMIGDLNMELLRSIKEVFDPKGIFNPGKIIDPFLMDQRLRTPSSGNTPELKTQLDFSKNKGLIRATEQCNGSGDCRKLSGGAMCPSYRATRNEKDSTRARTNALRDFLYRTDKKNPFDRHELKQVFELCLSCKACAHECPSNVDVAAFKSEFLYQYHKSNRRPISDYVWGHIGQLNAFASVLPQVVNGVSFFLKGLLKKGLGIAPKRSLPQFSAQTLLDWFHGQTIPNAQRSVYLLVDEFTNALDASIGKSAVRLLSRLGYEVCVIGLTNTGRSEISKGFLQKAKALADQNITLFSSVINEDTPLIGIEPSALYCFKDEYPKLFTQPQKANNLAQHCYLIDDFLCKEMDKGYIDQDSFTLSTKKIKFHAHCYQKALGEPNQTLKILSFPKNYEVEQIPSGCCGMAGSFGYQHFEISMKIGEEVLFPTIRSLDETDLVVANGNSCRHQIKDGTQRDSLHPVEVLEQALIA